MKHLIPLCMIALFACNEKPKPEKEVEVKPPPDNMQGFYFRMMLDTTGMYQSPVQVARASIFNRDQLSNKDIEIVFKNVSDKKITAIRFRWYIINKLGDAADINGGITKGFGHGLSEDALEPNMSDTASWELAANDIYRIAYAFPYEVEFADGDQWRCGKY